MVLTGRRIHREVGENLQHMVLHHVADRASFVIEAAAILHAELFCHRDLDIANESPIPERLENRVGKTCVEAILHWLLTEIVVDAKNSILGKILMQDAIEFTR